ncbi:MAG TPA: PQ-loop repeat-containing protein [Acidimicrobiia bacterium]|nr:PQ-loop repeat-containing protein [Acidimicrobiia bacterium]
MAIEWLGFMGTGLVMAAYVPQVAHLLRARCAGGVSLGAYLVWSTAAILLLTYAIASGDPVFIALQGYQLVTLASISLLSIRRRASLCDLHCGPPPPSPAANKARTPA